MKLLLSHPLTRSDFVTSNCLVLVSHLGGEDVVQYPADFQTAEFNHSRAPNTGFFEHFS